MAFQPKQLHWVRRVQVPEQLPVVAPTARERLVAALAERPRTVAQLAHDFELSQPTMLEQVRRALRDGLIAEVEVPPEQRRSAGERYYGPTVPVITRADRELLEPACRALAIDMAAAVTERRGDLLAAFELTHLARDGWEFSDLWPYMQDVMARMMLHQMPGLLAEAALEPHGLAWVEDLVDDPDREVDDETKGVA